MGSKNRNNQRRNNYLYRAMGSARSIIESLEGRTLMSTYMVTTTADSGAGSLRQAITDSNNHAGADDIHFAIGSGAKTISPTKSLPALSSGTNLDATTQPGFAGKPLITLNGSGAGSADGIKITGSGATVRGLVINHFSGSGVFIFGSGGNRVAGCFIGTDSSGNGGAGNGAHGILVQSPGNTIGGLAANDRNVISANGLSGVFLYTAAAAHNTVEGNFIGSAATGSDKLGNARNGVQIDGAAGNTIGGTAGGAGNLISGNARDGVLIVNSGSAQNVVQSNYIGVTASGSARLGNGWYGVEISRPDNVIGGRGAGNVISANGYGGVVMYEPTSSGNRVQGNFIGTDSSGTKDLGNIGRGVEFTNSAHDNRVGGTRSGEGNVISGNDNGGVGFYSLSSMNLLQGNLIGTSVSGIAGLGNTGAGVMVTDRAGTNFIGGPNAGNTISANTAQGIMLTGGTSPTIVQANKVGTDASGTKKLGNALDGILVASSLNQIGGKKKGTGNVISGNMGNGLFINGSHGNLVRRNIVGADASGTKAVGNGKTGVVLSTTSTTPIRGNTIAYNGSTGVSVNGGADNAIVSNSIHDNTGLGIKLGTQVQAAPAITSVGSVVGGSITGKANSTIYVEFFSIGSTESGGFGEGATFLGAAMVKLNASGAGSFSAKLGPLPAGKYITATATGGTGSTSQFSKAMHV